MNNTVTYVSKKKNLWKTWHPTSICTVCYIMDGKGKVLLIERKKKGFGNGKVCAPGGHREKGETTEQCCIRETMEEVGMKVFNPIHVGTLNFMIPNNDMEGHVYVATEYEGTPIETLEARPFWADISALPFDRMFNDDTIWLHHALNYEPFTLFAICNKDGDTLSYEIEFDGPECEL